MLFRFRSSYTSRVILPRNTFVASAAVVKLCGDLSAFVFSPFYRMQLLRNPVVLRRGSVNMEHGSRFAGVLHTFVISA